MPAATTSEASPPATAPTAPPASPTGAAAGRGRPAGATPARPAGPAEATAARRRPWRAALIGGVVLMLAAAGGARLWWLSRHVAETDNATIAGHLHPVASRLGGVVLRVAVEDNATVRQGQTLLVLDPADQQATVERLEAQRAQVDAQIGGSAAQSAQARAQVAAAQAQVAQAETLLAKAGRDVERARRLSAEDTRFLSPQALDAAVSTQDAAQADLAARRAGVAAAEQGLRASLAAREAALAQREVLEAQLRDARLQLGYATVTAPADGRIGKRTVETGQRVQAGQQLMAVVEDGVWIVANFKETQLARMRPGQPATVHVDALPGQVLHARLESFAPASGASFALLPPDNATGNFTKIVQRVPVRLALDPADAAAWRGRLVPGLSATVAVDLGD